MGTGRSCTDTTPTSGGGGAPCSGLSLHPAVINATAAHASLRDETDETIKSPSAERQRRRLYRSSVESGLACRQCAGAAPWRKRRGPGREMRMAGGKIVVRQRHFLVDDVPWTKSLAGGMMLLCEQIKLRPPSGASCGNSATPRSYRRNSSHSTPTWTALS